MHFTGAIKHANFNFKNKNADPLKYFLGRFKGSQLWQITTCEAKAYLAQEYVNAITYLGILILARNVG